MKLKWHTPEECIIDGIKYQWILRLDDEETGEERVFIIDKMSDGSYMITYNGRIARYNNCKTLNAAKGWVRNNYKKFI